MAQPAQVSERKSFFNIIFVRSRKQDELPVDSNSDSAEVQGKVATRSGRRTAENVEHTQPLNTFFPASSWTGDAQTCQRYDSSGVRVCRIFFRNLGGS